MIKRAAILKDPDEFKRNVNIYVISENSSGKLTAANTTLKNNLKNWITQYKMISDTVDILDAEIVNFDISYEILTDINANRFDVINSCNERLTSKFIMKQDIGEPIKITDIYRELQKVNGVVDVTSVDVGLKSGGIYSESNYDFDAALSSDGRMIEAQPNIVFELKYPNVDIKGSIR